MMLSDEFTLPAFGCASFNYYWKSENKFGKRSFFFFFLFGGPRGILSRRFREVVKGVGEAGRGGRVAVGRSIPLS